MKKKIFTLISIAVVVLLSFTLVACSSNGSGTDAGASESVSESADTPASESTEAADAQTSESAGDAQGSGDTITIGVTFGTLQDERWNQEMQYIKDRAAEIGGIEIIEKDANLDANLQNQQMEDFITQGVDAIIIQCHDSEAAAQSVDAAKAAGITVVSYVRLIETDAVDFHMGTDFRGAGAAQVQTAFDMGIDSGNWAFIGGDPASSAGIDLHDGAMDAAQELIDSGQITVAGDEWIQNWDAEGAMAAVENVLTKYDNDIQAIICNSSGMAIGVSRALAAQGLEGTVYYTGSDCDLEACRRIVEGKQAMDIYYDGTDLAYHAVDAVVALLKDDGSINDLTMGVSKLNTVDAEIPTYYGAQYYVTKDNIDEIIIGGGFQTVEDVYANMPQEDWPQQ